MQAIFNAATAQSSANNAQTSANNAQSAADKAQTSANNAQTTANTATNAKRVIKVENLYYLSQINGENSRPSVPVINNNCPISDEILESGGWSTVYPNLKYDYDFVSCDTGSMSAVYTCQRLTVIQNGVQSYEFTAVTQDHTTERLYAMTNGRTIIEGGYIKTDLLDVNKIFARQIKLQNTQNGDTTVYGSIYGGERYNADGTDNDTTSKGFYLGADGTLKAKDGYFEGEINATSGILDSISATNCEIGGSFFDNSGSFVCNFTTDDLFSEIASFFETLMKNNIMPKQESLFYGGSSGEASRICNIFVKICPVENTTIVLFWGFRANFYRSKSSIGSSFKIYVVRGILYNRALGRIEEGQVEITCSSSMESGGTYHFAKVRVRGGETDAFTYFEHDTRNNLTFSSPETSKIKYDGSIVLN